LSRRVRQIEISGTTTNSDHRMLWCGQALCEERDSTGATVTKRFFWQGEQIGGTSYFFNRDHLGSIRELTDSAASVRARYDYDPWGRRTKVVGDLEADFGFTGHYYHAPSSLHLALYRAYSAELGRWSSRDPVPRAELLPEGANVYLYLGNSPTIHTDPTGLLKACYRPIDGSDWMGSCSLLWHAFIKFDDGSSASDTGPDPGTSKHIHCYDAKPDPKSCKAKTEDCVKKAAAADTSSYDFIHNNCGQWVAKIFKSCGFKDPTPPWLGYY
jgi:RHS repeat-associated protein